MEKTINIRLTKDNDGNICFKYRDSDVVRTPYGLTSLIEGEIRNGAISKGEKIEDNDYIRYIFNYYDSNEINAVQKPIKIVIRVRREYLDESYDVLKSLDALCLQTYYIKSKNIIKILAISLSGIAILSMVGAKIVDRIKDPIHYDFGRNNEYSSNEKSNIEQKVDNEKQNIYDEVYNNLHRR